MAVASDLQARCCNRIWEQPGPGVRVRDQESAEAHLSPVTSIWEHPYCAGPRSAYLCNGADCIGQALLKEVSRRGMQSKNLF